TRPWCEEVAALVPLELRQRRQWVVWGYRLSQDGTKWTKVPFQAKNPAKRASTTDPRTWATVGEAVAAFLAKRDSPEGSRLDGVGFVFSADDPYIGIDFDHAAGQSWAPDHLDRLNSYTGVSPSGKGFKAIVKGTPPDPKGRKKTGLGPGGTGAIEVYSQGRFFTITGDRCDRWSVDVEERTAAVSELHATIFPPKAAPGPKAKPPVPAPPESDDDILRRAFASRHGPEIETLFSGDTARYDGDESSADLALCNHLAFWFCGDAAAIDRVFRRSGLLREKWDERRGATTYGARTIAKALEDRTEFYEPSPPPSANGRRKREPQAKTGTQADAPRPRDDEDEQEERETQSQALLRLA